jgi:hypothetical protein
MTKVILTDVTIELDIDQGRSLAKVILTDVTIELDLDQGRSLLKKLPL